MTPAKAKLMRDLAANDGQLCLSGARLRTARQLVRPGFVQGIGARWYGLTDAGREWLSDHGSEDG